MHVSVEQRDGKIRCAVVLEKRCIVDHASDRCRADCLHRLRQQLFHGGFIGQIALHRSRAPAESFDITHCRLRIFGGLTVVHDHVPAALRERERNAAPDALGGTCH
jgi:hypothetical protein